MGEKTIKVQVVDVKEHATKENAGEMYHPM